MGLIKGAMKGAWGSAKFVGKAAWNVGKVPGYASVKTGQSIIKNGLKAPVATAAAIGGAAIGGYMLSDADGNPDPGRAAGMAGAGMALATAVPGMAAAGTGLAAAGVGAGTAIAGVTAGIGTSMIKVPDRALKFSEMGELSFNKLGTGVLLAGAGIEGTKRAVDKFNRGRMGQHDGMVHTQTPTLPQQTSTSSYSNNGGATGDLVFSLYNNR